MVRRYKARVVALSEQLASCSTGGGSGSSLAFDRTTKSGALAKRKLSLHGQFAVAVRRNVSHISSETLALTTLDTFTRWSVNRHECKYADALKKSMATTMQNIRESHDSDDVTIIGLRSDATNSNVWKKNKVIATEVVLRFLVHPSEETYSEAFMHDKLLCDILPAESGSGVALIAALLKQLHSVGCKSWTEPAPGNSIEAWCVTSDRGGDQVRARKIMSAEVADDPRKLMLTSDCFEHSTHLVVKGSLNIVDAMLAEARRPKYYSSLAKIVNVWRSVPKGVYAAWQDRYGVMDANRCAKNLCPPAPAGRWGAVSNVESKFKSVDLEKLHVCLGDALQKKQLQRPKAIQGYNPNEELHVEEQAAYSAKLGRWRKDALAASGDLVFVRLVLTVPITRAPCSHMHAFLKKHIDQAQRDVKGNHYAQLIGGKAHEIFSEFEAALDSPELIHATDDLNQDDALLVRRIVVASLFKSTCGFHRRVVVPLKNYEWLRLLESPAGVPCDVRRDIAQRLLSTASPHLEINAAKLKALFPGDLEHAAATGKLECTQHIKLLQGLREAMMADTRDQESLNKVIGVMGKRAPNISLDLLSARAGLKHYLGVSKQGQLTSKARIQETRRNAEALVDLCSAFANAPIEDKPEYPVLYRWAQARHIPQTVVAADARTDDIVHRIDPSRFTDPASSAFRWANANAVLFARRELHDTKMECGNLIDNVYVVGGDAFLVADFYALDAEMLPCIIHDDDSYIEVHTTHCICSSAVLVLAMARATFKYYISACVAAMARATHI